MGLKEFLIFWLIELGIFPCKDAVEISTGKYCGIGENFIVPLDVGKMNLLLYKKLIEFRIPTAMGISDKVI
jgi:hypothetical protein